MAAATSAAFAAFAAVPGPSFARDCSSSSPNRATKGVSIVLPRRGPRESQLTGVRVISPRALNVRASSTGPPDGDGGSELGSDEVLVSRRWAALSISLPGVAALVALPSREARGEGDVRIEGGGKGAGNEGGGGRVELRTLNGFGLGIARYPNFVYNAEGGRGSGLAQKLVDGRTRLRFDVDRLYVPAVSADNATILGAPLPPGLKLEIVPRKLEGFVEEDTGKVELDFAANFYFSVESLYSAPPLVVDIKLTTEPVQGVFRGGEGQRLDSSGNVKLVGVAKMAPVKDIFLRTFLTLPTDCLAELPANLSFV